MISSINQQNTLKTLNIVKGLDITMDKINETAAAGSTVAHSIAVVPGNRLGGMQSRMSLKNFMLNFYSGVKNNGKGYRPLPIDMQGSISKISESSEYPYQLDAATSRLKGMEKEGGYEASDSISYGIQDDMGNLMLVTVPMEQSEELERRCATALADVLDFKKTGNGENKTLAELLYELKDEFTIIDAQFPTIPKDAVYNADEVSALPEADGDGPEGMGGEDELGGEGPEGMGGEDELGGEGPEGMGGEDELDGDDADIGDDFAEEPDKESLLISVLGMLKSQNEKETAQAKAEEEKAKAQQAEIALKSSSKEMESQEEMVAAQAEMDAEKEKEKKVKERANLAKYNYNKRKGMGEGFSDTFRSMILELDANDTTASLNREKMTMLQKYKVGRNDTQEERTFKQKQFQAAKRELQAKMRAARNQEVFAADQQDKEEQQAKMDQGEEETQAGQPMNPQRGPQ